MEHTPAKRKRLVCQLGQLPLCIPISRKAKYTPLSPRISAMANIGEAHIHIDYSSPSVRSRTIWGGWVAYDQVWVMGALKSFFLGRGNLINRQP